MARQLFTCNLNYHDPKVIAQLPQEHWAALIRRGIDPVWIPVDGRYGLDLFKYTTAAPSPEPAPAATEASETIAKPTTDQPLRARTSPPILYRPCPAMVHPRWARSMRQLLLSTIDDLQRRGIGLRSLHENIDTSSAAGRLILHIFAALGQFEMELLRERTRIALAANRARGGIGGRPPALDAMKITAAKAMLSSGTMTAAEVARQLGCSASTLYRCVPGGRTVVASAETRISAIT